MSRDDAVTTLGASFSSVSLVITGDDGDVGPVGWQRPGLGEGLLWGWGGKSAAASTPHVPWLTADAVRPLSSWAFQNVPDLQRHSVSQGQPLATDDGSWNVEMTVQLPRPWGSSATWFPRVPRGLGPGGQHQHRTPSTDRLPPLHPPTPPLRASLSLQIHHLPLGLWQLRRMDAGRWTPDTRGAVMEVTCHQHPLASGYSRDGLYVLPAGLSDIGHWVT